MNVINARVMNASQTTESQKLQQLNEVKLFHQANTEFDIQLQERLTESGSVNLSKTDPECVCTPLSGH